MEHTPQTCPNKIEIDKVVVELKEVKEMYHDLDKQTGISMATTEQHYKTIISMLTTQVETSGKMGERVSALEKMFMVNDYKTNKSTDLIERVTWGFVAKIGVGLTFVGTILLALYKGAM